MLKNPSLSSTVNPIQNVNHPICTFATMHLSRSVFFNRPALRRSQAHHIHEWPGPQTLYSAGSKSRSAALLRNRIWCKGTICVDPRNGIPGCRIVNSRVVLDNVTNLSLYSSETGFGERSAVPIFKALVDIFVSMSQQARLLRGDVSVQSGRSLHL